MTLGALSQVVQPGTYAIRIQYEDGGGGNTFLLGGVPQMPADPAFLFTGLELDGTQNRTVSNSIPADFTVQFWLKTSQFAGSGEAGMGAAGLVDGTLAGKVPGLGIFLEGGKIALHAGGSPALRSRMVAAGQWHHISARRVQASGEVSLFVDGREEGRALGSTDAFSAATELTIGSLANGTQFLEGAIDQFRMWSTARSTEQIAADCHATRSSHGFADAPPSLRIAPSGDGVELFWDPLSSYRVLESSVQLEGPYLRLPTDQNTTNLPSSGALRFFRVRR
jgi:hypothetical protein